MTEQEKNLWYKFLRNYNIKFVKQKVIGDYIVDFYCNSAKLIVELDGSHHYSEENIKKDKERTKFLNSLGMRIIRFSNKECDENFDGVCLEIDKQIKKLANI